MDLPVKYFRTVYSCRKQVCSITYYSVSTIHDINAVMLSLISLNLIMLGKLCQAYSLTLWHWCIIFSVLLYSACSCRSFVEEGLGVCLDAILIIWNYCFMFSIVKTDSSAQSEILCYCHVTKHSVNKRVNVEDQSNPDFLLFNVGLLYILFFFLMELLVQYRYSLYGSVIYKT